MEIAIRWRSYPPLFAVSALTLLPAATVWAAALLQAARLGHPLDQLVAPPATAVARLAFVGLLTLGPALAALAGFLAIVDLETTIGHWELGLRLRLPSPPWSGVQVAALLSCALAALLFAAMTGHLAADCFFGGDCGWG